MDAPSIETDTIIDFFSTEFGPVDPYAFAEIVHRWPPIAVHRIRKNNKSEHQILFTTGMSQNHSPAHAEVYIVLTADWPLDTSDLEHEQYRWPIMYLRELALLPHETGAWLDAPVGVFHGNTSVTAGGFSGSFAFQRHCIPFGENRQLGLFQINALFQEELELVEQQGLPALLQAFDDHKISPAVNPARKNVGLQ